MKSIKYLARFGLATGLGALVAGSLLLWPAQIGFPKVQVTETGTLTGPRTLVCPEEVKNTLGETTDLAGVNGSSSNAGASVTASKVFILHAKGSWQGAEIAKGNSAPVGAAQLFSRAKLGGFLKVIPDSVPDLASAGAGTVFANDADRANHADDANHADRVEQANNAGTLDSSSRAPKVASVQVQLNSTGVLRGLSASSCFLPTGETYLVGGATTPGNSAQIVVSNPGEKSVAVQVSVLSQNGSENLSLGASSNSTNVASFALGSGKQRTLLLESQTVTKELAVRVEARGGKVAAYMNVLESSGITAQGADVVTPAAILARSIFIPLALNPLPKSKSDDLLAKVVPPSGQGTASDNVDGASKNSANKASPAQKDTEDDAKVIVSNAPVLRLVNPGNLDSEARVEIYTTTGKSILEGAEKVVVASHTVIDLPLDGIKYSTTGVAVVASRPLTAALKLVMPADKVFSKPDAVTSASNMNVKPQTGLQDFTWIPAQESYTRAVFLRPDPQINTKLLLLNPGDKTLELQIVPYGVSGEKRSPFKIAIKPHSAAKIQWPQAADVLEIEPSSQMSSGKTLTSVSFVAAMLLEAPVVDGKGISVLLPQSLAENGHSFKVQVSN